MKKIAILALVCINVALLATLLAPDTPRAEAQTFRGAYNYVMFTGRIEEDYDAVYVIDVGARRMRAWKMDRTTKRLSPYRTGRNLDKDFGSR